LVLVLVKQVNVLVPLVLPKKNVLPRRYAVPL
jgi:hypothetical protein